MDSLKQKLSKIIGEAFASSGWEPRLGTVVPSQRPDLCEFQCNGAMAAAKQAGGAGGSPRALAQSILERLKGHAAFSDLSIAGPGFINIVLHPSFLAEHLQAMSEDERAGCAVTERPVRITIDFGGPNVAKAMHVGHLRSCAIGDALQRLCRFLGHHVVSDVHLGDWGTQMGMLLMEMKRRDPALPYFDAAKQGPYPSTSPVSIEDLEAMYPEAVRRCGADDQEMEQARSATMELQQGRHGYVALWRHFVSVSMEALKRDFGRLGVTFDLWYGESRYNERISGLIERLERQGHAIQDQGALIVPLGDPGQETPPLILVKSDGGFLYGTTDLATLEERIRDQRAQRILYVVDSRQSTHFRQVFSAAAKIGLSEGCELVHVAFGTVNGPDGKPYKTRVGGVMKLHDLMGMAVEEAFKKMSDAGVALDYPEEERRAIAERVGLGALKFADLVNHRVSDYVFDLDKFTSFEGKTGPYVMYAAVRIKSILRKAAEKGLTPGPLLPSTPGDHELMLFLTHLPESLAGAYTDCTPHLVCDYVFNLAQSFSRFYQNCHILREPDPARQASWLTLSALCLKEMELALGLLGITVPERM